MKHVARCQCGALSVESAADPDFVIACNCKACQRRTGAAYGVGAYFTRDNLTITGDKHGWSRKADTGRSLTNYFCPHCGTNVCWSLEMRPDHMGVALGCLETPVGEPARAIWTSQKFDWVTFPEHWPTFEEGTPEKQA